MPIILHHRALWTIFIGLLSLMVGSVVINYYQLQQVRDLRETLSRVQDQSNTLYSKREALRAQVAYELSRERIGQLQQQRLPHLQPVNQFVSFDALPFRADGEISSTPAPQGLE